jgi:hypothetical protein
MFRDLRSVLGLSLGLMPLAFPSASLGQASRQVMAELRIESQWVPWTSLQAADVQRAVAADLAKAAHDHFRYLIWTPAVSTPAAPSAGGSSGPHLVLKVTDGPIADVTPPALRLTLLTERDGRETWSHLLSNLSEVGNIAMHDWPARQFRDNIRVQVDAYFAEADTLKNIQDHLLARVVLADHLLADQGKRRIFLPLKEEDLMAARQSLLHALFGPAGTDGELRMHPWGPDGDRTMVYVQEFHCGEAISSGGPVRETYGVPWHARLGELLSACHDPSIYMETYVPGEPVHQKGGVITDLTGGKP